MRLTPLVLTLATLTTLPACKREDSSSPADASTTTSDAEAPSTDAPTNDDAEPEPSAEPSADSLAACKHMGALMHAQLGELVETSEEELAAMATECARDIDSKRATMSAEAWETWHGCAMAAQTVEAAAACG